jgi:formylglycine-generating enzyme required for sulfatase activity
MAVIAGTGDRMLHSRTQPRIFISHSSADNDAAVCLFDWLEREGWKDEIFLDLDPERGIAAGDRWERKLNETANRCEVVLFLVSKAWLGSIWCRKELNLAHRLNKRLYGVLIEDMQPADLPKDLTGEWQVVRLASGRDHVMLHAVLPVTHDPVTVTFSAEGLQRLKHGLELAGLDPKYFTWPPEDDPNRPPYRGLRSLEAEDAGIFFGREAPAVQALDKLRGLREAAPPRLLVILGASGAGKSSFMRAGLLPRLVRDHRHFLPLPIIRPERAVLFGENGLLRALEDASKVADIATPRADLRAAIEGGAAKLRPHLQALARKMTSAAFAAPAPIETPALACASKSSGAPARNIAPALGVVPTAAGDTDKPRPPTLILPIDQGEELFRAEGLDEARAFLTLLWHLLGDDDPPLIALFTIRSDAYELLQSAKELEGLRQEMINLPPMPKGSYADVITGPALRLRGTKRALALDENLVETLLTDIDEGGGKDALALLSFTLERLYLEYGGRKKLTVDDYTGLNGIKGSIEAAVEQAFKAADKDPTIPQDRNARLALLRRGFIPWLAGIDPDTGSPRRRLAGQSEIPQEARPLIGLLVEQRLLATDVAKETGEQTVEPVHEALLRQWVQLQDWLAEDTGLLGLLEGVKRAARDWSVHGKNAGWLIHTGNRLYAAQRLVRERPDLAAHLRETDRDYLAACHKLDKSSRGQLRRRQALVGGLLLCLVIGLIGWWQEARLVALNYWFFNVRPYVETAAAEQSLQPGEIFKECRDCPEMVVIPHGHFTMGSPDNEIGRWDEEGPQHTVTFAKPFAVARDLITFDEWDTCVRLRGCTTNPPAPWGRGRMPVVNVDWEDAQQYVTWLSKLTGKRYRLLSESEWEYAARAGTTTAYYWGPVIDTNHADCDGCGSQWDSKQPAPVEKFAANAFGLYDMAGNVWQMVQDCYQANYKTAPTDGSPNMQGDCSIRVVRGGAWTSDPPYLRSASRYKNAINDHGSTNRDFRVARDLTQ